MFTTMFSKTKYNTNLEDEAIYAKIKDEKLALEIEEINIKKAELELKKRKIEYETKKFEDKIKQEFKKDEKDLKDLKETKKKEEKYFKDHKCKFKKILDELIAAFTKQKCISYFVSDKIKKTNDKNHSIKKKTLLQEFNYWCKEEYGKRKMPKDVELYNYMTKKFGLPDSTKGWVGLEFIYDEEEDFITNT
jgi:hypothetical protein